MSASPTDMQEIVDVAIRYTWALDENDWAALDDVFLPDATAVLGGGPELVGREAIVALAQGELNRGLVARDRAGEFNLSGWRKLAEFGVHGLHVPHEYGGMGLDALTTVGVALALFQVVSAWWLYGRRPLSGPRPTWLGPAHRWSGTAAFVLTLPAAYHCLWALGFQDTTPRVLIHSLVGCAFYGAFTTKLLLLRSERLPGWAAAR